jgi:hypothetical protein
MNSDDMHSPAFAINLYRFMRAGRQRGMLTQRKRIVKRTFAREDTERHLTPQGLRKRFVDGSTIKTLAESGPVIAHGRVWKEPGAKAESRIVRIARHITGRVARWLGQDGSGYESDTDDDNEGDSEVRVENMFVMTDLLAPTPKDHRVRFYNYLAFVHATGAPPSSDTALTKEEIELLPSIWVKLWLVGWKGGALLVVSAVLQGASYVLLTLFFLAAFSSILLGAFFPIVQLVQLLTSDTTAGEQLNWNDAAIPVMFTICFVLSLIPMAVLFVHVNARASVLGGKECSVLCGVRRFHLFVVAFCTRVR